MDKRLEILGKETVYQGFFRLDRYRLRHSLFGGGESKVLVRELFERGHAVGVLPYDPVRDEVVLVEQFRVGALEEPDGPWLLEIVAGMIEPGEQPQEVAHREAAEEAGCVLQELVPVARYYSSPGGSSERVTVFCARVSTEGLGGIHGEPSEGEDIGVVVLPFAEAFALVENGRIKAALPIIALQWLALNRERLRREWGGG